MKRIVQIGERVKAETGMQFDVRSIKEECVLRNQTGSLKVEWWQMYGNTVMDEAYILTSELNRWVVLPGERSSYVMQAKTLNEHRFKPELSVSRELRWVEISKGNELLTDDDVANRIVTLFVDLVSKPKLREMDFYEHEDDD
jgi:hypothetical protein